MISRRRAQSGLCLCLLLYNIIIRLYYIIIEPICDGMERDPGGGVGS